jgi:histidine triad (HIT) family protein
MCIFCRIVKGEARGEIVYQDEEVTAFRDIHPKAPTHILVVPNKHIRSLTYAEPDDTLLLGRLLQVAKDLAEQEGIAGSGYRLVMNCGYGAGQVVNHLHFHLLGGWSMD